MPLLTTTGVCPSLHTWREYDCLLLQLPENILFPATRRRRSDTGSLNFTLPSSKSWVRSKEMARRLHDHWLIGLSTSVLTHDFVTSYQHGDNVEVGPFSGRLMLPTKLQVLKLHLFFRDEAGKKNQNVSKGEVTKVLLESCWIWDNYHFKA